MKCIPPVCIYFLIYTCTVYTTGTGGWTLEVWISLFIHYMQYTALAYELECLVGKKLVFLYCSTFVFI